MKDTIIKLKNNDSFYILEELNYKHKKYVIASQYNEESDSINQEELELFEVVMKDNSLALDNVWDDEVAKEILTKYQKVVQSR